MGVLNEDIVAATADVTEVVILVESLQGLVGRRAGQKHIAQVLHGPRRAIGEDNGLDADLAIGVGDIHADRTGVAGAG